MRKCHLTEQPSGDVSLFGTVYRVTYYIGMCRVYKFPVKTFFEKVEEKC